MTRKELGAILEQIGIKIDITSCWWQDLLEHIKSKMAQKSIMLDDIIQYFDSEVAYYWGMYIGNRDIMLNLITDSFWCYIWQMSIGDREIMRARIINNGDFDKYQF